MIGQPFDYTHDGQTLLGQLARPVGPGPHPAALVMPDALGLAAFHCRKAEQLAAAGYVTLAADMYGTGFDTGGQAGAGPLFMALQENPERLRSRVVTTFETLRALPGVDPDRIIAFGYCFGGQCVLELARSGANLRAVVSFHGLLTTRSPPQPGSVKARMLSITGALDPYVPLEHVAGFQAEMTQAGADWQATVYGTGWHAFTDPTVERDHDVPGVRYDALLDRLSWAQATEFVEAASGSPGGQGWGQG